MKEIFEMRGHEPGGKNQSTDGSGVGGGPMKAKLNGEQPQGADGDGCLGTVQDRPADFGNSNWLRETVEKAVVRKKQIASSHFCHCYT